MAAEPETFAGVTLPWRDPLTAFAPLEAFADSLLLLSDPARADRTGAGSGPFSYIAAFPERTLRGEPGAPWPGVAGLDPRANAAYPRAQDTGGASGTPAFVQGVAGLFGYELAGAFERLERPCQGTGGFPDAALGWYPAVAAFDHARHCLTVSGDPAAAERLAGALGVRTLAALTPPSAARLKPDETPATVKDRLAQARDHVIAGDVFQVNISQGFSAVLAAGDDPWSVFRRLVAASPAPHAAYLRLGPTQVIATHSPERFLRIEPDGTIETRPIKGTRPRGATPAEDAALAAALLVNEKDRAENLMIVDLMRNDLARVCEPGSVRTPQLLALESYANVHHLVSAVTGRLRTGVGLDEVLAATFPPGSITGAPKVRAMQIIAALEGEARGPYCGALGYSDASGRTDLNVMIRTLGFWQDEEGGWRAVFRSGGAVVADSQPEDEYQEHLDKASSIMAALGASRERQAHG